MFKISPGRRLKVKYYFSNKNVETKRVEKKNMLILIQTTNIELSFNELIKNYHHIQQS